LFKTVSATTSNYLWDKLKFWGYIVIDKGIANAWLLFLAIWILPLFVHVFRNRAQLLLAYWFVIFLHQVVAFINFYWFATIGAQLDSNRFHAESLKLYHSEKFYFAVDGYFFHNFLGALYWLFGPSQLLGYEFSILAFAVSCIILIKILHLLELSRYEVPILLAFGALPSIVIFGSVTLRESYQVLFFMLTVYWGMKMQMKGDINRYLFLMIVSALVMGLFHNGLQVYSTFLIVLAMVWSLRPGTYFWSVKKLRVMAVFATLVLIVAVTYSAKIEVEGGIKGLVALANGKLLETTAVFRKFSEVTISRATYLIPFDLSTPYTTIYSISKMYVYYLFAPFPWQVKNVLDAYAAMETFLRITLIYFSVKHWFNAYGVRRRLLGLMLILFFSMTFMWSMGTTNYGTAIRHHMLSWWILFIAGLPLLMESLNRVWIYLSVRKHTLSLEPTEKTF
jgi:hypothetical protein